MRSSMDCAGASEEIVGRWLAKHPELRSKVGRVHFNPRGGGEGLCVWIEREREVCVWEICV